MTGVLELVTTITTMFADKKVDVAEILELLRKSGDAFKDVAMMFTQDNNILLIFTGINKVLDGAADITEGAYNKAHEENIA